MRLILLAFCAIGIYGLFLYAVLDGIGAAAALPIPHWWWVAFPSKSVGMHVFNILTEALVLLTVSGLFAFAVSRVFGRAAAAVSIAIAAATAVMTQGPSLAGLFATPSAGTAIEVLLEAAILVVALPIFVKALEPRPSITRSSGP